MADPIRAPFYHDGMRELQDRFDGRRVADGLEKHRLHFEFWEQDRKLIEETRFFFVATSYQDPWITRRSNQSILKEISPEYSLEGLMLKLKLQYFGHLM
ncbi:hypothetical protein BLX87_00945 [Bacillus sp. VT-16-64]|nr:hypothetical protein BLX87_00945 [Bacillus sp. VT-16-64]